MAKDFGRGKCNSCGLENKFTLKELGSASGVRCIACGGRVHQDIEQQMWLARKRGRYFAKKSKK